jgi:hypothetical protein
MTFEVPAGGASAELSPGDNFPVDDTVYVAAPSKPTVDTMLVTNDRNRYLYTALSVVDAVDLEVVEPPAPDAPVDEQDVVVFSNVDPELLLGGTVESAGAVAADGGGVAIQAQPNFGRINYRGLSLLEPTGTGDAPSVTLPTNDPITRGITFPPPETYVRGSLTRGQSLVATTGGSPLIATATHERGRLLYYGYLENASSFKYNYQYPVFWKRAVFFLAGRQSLPQLNHATGERLRFGETTVTTPEGEVNGTSVRAVQVGWYQPADGDRHGVSLLSPTESDVQATPLEARSDGAPEPRDEERYVPQAVTHWVALVGLLLGVLELAYLKRRGDI